MGFSRHSISFCRVVLLSGSCGDFVEFSLEPLDLMFELPEADTVWSDEHEIRGDPAIVMPGRTRDIDVGARLTWYVFGLTREENESKGITGEVIDAHLHSPFQRSSSETRGFESTRV